MKVCLVGGPSREPAIVKMKRGKSIQQEVEKRMNYWTHKTPFLIKAPPGSGKTSTVSKVLIPWAKSKGINVCYVCPRIGPGIQAKRSFIAELGETQLLDQLTDEGIQALDKVGNVSVMTAQHLYTVMKADPVSLSRFGLLIFDEVHLLLDDALFSSSTGYVLEHLRDYFGGAIRIYLSATPDAVLPHLVRAEAPYTIQMLDFPVDYSYIRPWFFQDVDELVKKINSDATSNKWLIYVPTISEGQRLKNLLSCSVRLLNRVEREEDQGGWNKILREEQYEEKVCICTAVVDVGVNFKDPLLRNVVIFSLNPNTIIQFLGRKRRTNADKVALYVKCPSQHELRTAMTQNQSLMEAVALYHQDNPRFIRQHILASMERDLRGWVYVADDGKLNLNSLVSQNLQAQKCLLEKLGKRATENKGDCCFDKFVAQLLHIQLPDRSECWLDPQYSGAAKIELEHFLAENIGKKMNEEDFSRFSEQFRSLCVAAFGTNGGKDHPKRDWGLRKISNRLDELDWGYFLKVDPITKIAWLELTDTEPDNEQGGEQ